MIDVGATSLGWSGVALPAVFEDLRALGGTCIELNSRPGLHDGLIVDQDIDIVARWAREAGVAISSVAGYNDFAQHDADALDLEVARLLYACRLASELEVGIVRAFAGEPAPGRTLASVWPSIVEGFRRAGEGAAALGVTLAIENHGRLLNDGAMLASLVGEIGSQNVGLNVDTGNFSWGGHDLAETWDDFDAVLPLAVNVHIKDVDWHDGSPQFVPAGAGELDIARVLARLEHLEYRGVLLSEYEGPPPHREGTRESIRFLRRAQTASRR